jgi:hypothetical protein
LAGREAGGRKNTPFRKTSGQAERDEHRATHGIPMR